MSWIRKEQRKEHVQTGSSTVCGQGRDGRVKIQCAEDFNSTRMKCSAVSVHFKVMQRGTGLKCNNCKVVTSKFSGACYQ